MDQTTPSTTSPVKNSTAASTTPGSPEPPAGSAKKKTPAVNDGGGLIHLDKFARDLQRAKSAGQCFRQDWKRHIQSVIHSRVVVIELLMQMRNTELLEFLCQHSRSMVKTVLIPRAAIDEEALQ